MRVGPRLYSPARGISSCRAVDVALPRRSYAPSHAGDVEDVHPVQVEAHLPMVGDSSAALPHEPKMRTDSVVITLRDGSLGGVLGMLECQGKPLRRSMALPALLITLEQLACAATRRRMLKWEQNRADVRCKLAAPRTILEEAPFLVGWGLPFPPAGGTALRRA